MPINTFHKIVLLIAFVIYTLTAINSKGYYHFDEHYQIIEFANLKLGYNEPSDLAWEYQARIRPAFQPLIVITLFKALVTLGVQDGYLLALALRLLTMLLALTTITLFIRCSRVSVHSKYQRPYILLSYFLWFLPFLNVRFMSETWSGLLFLLSVAIIQNKHKKKYTHFLLIGFLLGVSFLCRFQTAFLIITLYTWLIVVHKIKFIDMLLMTIAAVMMVLVGIGIDTWFYEELVFTPWNYFQINILQNVAAQFGTAPWYYYIAWLWYLPGGALLFISLIVVLSKMPRLLFLWITIPFIIVHSVIAHKEGRFLFPLINFTPLLLILGWQEVVKWLQCYNEEIWRPAVHIILVAFFILNLAGLAQTTLNPVGDGSKAITYYIHKNYIDQELNLIYLPEANAYNPLNWLDLPETLYKDKNVTERSWEQIIASKDTAIFSVKNNLWIIKDKQLNSPDFLQLKDRYHLKLITQSFPEWSMWMTSIYNPAENDNVLLLYKQQ